VPSVNSHYLVGHYYILITLKGNVEASNIWYLDHPIPYYRNSYRTFAYWDYVIMMANDSRAMILVPDWSSASPGSNTKDVFTISKTEIVNGIVVSDQLELVNISLTALLSEYNLPMNFTNVTVADMGVLLFEGDESFSYLFYISPISYAIDPGHYEIIDLNDYEMFFFEKVSLEGQSLIPFTLLINASLARDSFQYVNETNIIARVGVLPPNTNDIEFTPIFVYDNTIFALIKKYINETITTGGLYSISLNVNGTQEWKLLRNCTSPYLEDWLYWYAPDEVISLRNAWPERDFRFTTFLFTTDTTSVHIAYYGQKYNRILYPPLHLISLEMHSFETKEYEENLTLLLPSEARLHDYSTTPSADLQGIASTNDSIVIVGRFSIDEFFGSNDDAHEFDYAYKATFDRNNVSYKIYGPEFETENEWKLTLSTLAGIGTGVIIPAYLLWLLRKRIGMGT